MFMLINCQNKEGTALSVGIISLGSSVADYIVTQLALYKLENPRESTKNTE